MVEVQEKPMEALAMYMTENEVLAERAYRTAYNAEYMRVFETQHAEDREHLLFWSELAHRAAKSARDKVLTVTTEEQAAA